MQTNPAVEPVKSLDGPRVRGVSPVGKEKVYGGKDLPKSQVLSSECCKRSWLPGKNSCPEWSVISTGTLNFKLRSVNQ